MCLVLKENAKEKIAEEDIICFKWLREVMGLSEDIRELDGEKFSGIINYIRCEGHVSVEDKVYFCTDCKDSDGLNCKDKKGHLYSWRYDIKVKSIIVKGKEYIRCNELITPYRRVPINIGEKYHSKIKKFQNRIHVALHSFKYLKDAKVDCIGLYEEKYVKCIIPKGAVYYEGVFNGAESYASNELVYLEIVE